VLIVVLNAKFHLFQKLIDLFIVVIVSDKTNHKIPEMIDIPEMTEAQDIPEMTEAQNHLMVKNLVEVILDLRNQKVINF